MTTQIPETFVWASIASAFLNVALSLVIAGMCKAWGVDKGRLIQIEQDKKVVRLHE